MKTVLAIDPGTTESAFVVWDGKVVHRGIVPNEEILPIVAAAASSGIDLIAIEMIACYGMAVGKETFETCVWIGRFMERATRPVHRVTRLAVKMHLCHSAKAKDGNVRQALIDKHGAPGTMKNKGPTYGIAKDLWAALAVADYAAECIVEIKEA